jgi:O-phosphoseryl-tRNA(Cys) synthetase
MSALEEYQAIIKRLLEKRQKVIDSYSEKIQKAEIDRDSEVLQITEELLRIGVSKKDIPIHETASKFKKLSDDLIKQTLRSYMKQGLYYSSTPILERLRISYPDFRAFVKKYPDFISKAGVNKGRKYTLNE